jgi:hypothetical protein
MVHGDVALLFRVAFQEREIEPRRGIFVAREAEFSPSSLGAGSRASRARSVVVGDEENEVAAFSLR